MSYLLKVFWQNIRLSLQLGADPYQKFLVFFSSLSFFLRNRTGISEQPVKLRLKAFGQIFDFFATNNNDIAVLREVFLLGEYDIKLPQEPKIIFDLGSNVGATVLYFCLKYKKAKVFAFEADPILFKKLLKNIEQFPNACAKNVVVSGSDGQTKFYVNEQNRISSSIIQRNSLEKEMVLSAKALDTLVRESGVHSIDLMKFDIEGAEASVFRNFKNISLVSTYIGEVHLDLINETEADEFFKVFSDFHVQKKTITENRLIVEIMSKNGAREPIS